MHLDRGQEVQGSLDSFTQRFSFLLQMGQTLVMGQFFLAQVLDFSFEFLVFGSKGLVFVVHALERFHNPVDLILEMSKTLESCGLPLGSAFSHTSLRSSAPYFAGRKFKTLSLKL